MRRIGLLCVLACALVLAPQALAARPELAEVGRSAHFALHAQPGKLTADGVSRALAVAESAWTKEATLGFWAPLDDGDGHVDLYLMPLAGGLAGVAPADPGPTLLAHSGYIEINESYGVNENVVAHELFHLVQHAVTPYMSSMIQEATATWAQVELRLLASSTVAPITQPLDCGNGCDAYDTAGPSPYARWSFFDFLSDKLGVGVIRDVIQAHTAFVTRSADAAVHDPMPIVDAALALHGTTAAAEFAAFAASRASGVDTGNVLVVDQGSPVSTTVSVDRWAARVVRVRATGAADCFHTAVRFSFDGAIGGIGPGMRPQFVVDGVAAGIPADGRVVFNGCSLQPSPLVLPNSGAATTVTVHAEAVASTQTQSSSESTAKAAAPKTCVPQAPWTLYVAPPRRTAAARSSVTLALRVGASGTLTVAGGRDMQTLSVQKGSRTVRVAVAAGTRKLTVSLADSYGTLLARTAVAVR